MKPRHSLCSHQGWCGLILNSLAWPQRHSVNRGIKFKIVLYCYPKEWNILGPGNQLWDPWESFSRYKQYSLHFQRFQGINPRLRFVLAQCRKDNILSSREQTALPTGLSRTFKPQATGIETHQWWRGQWSWFPPGNWLVEVVKAELWHNRINSHIPHTNYS